jgi:type I restriction enzyme S subunit
MITAIPTGKRAAYPAYKPSGISWLGDVPSHWNPVRLRYRARINPTKSELNGAPATTDVSFVPMEAVREYGGLSLDQTRPLGEVSNGYTYFRDGDVITAKITPCFENGKGAIAGGLVNGIGFGTTELHVLRPHAALDRHFLFYVTISHAFRNLGVAEMYGAGGQKRVPEDFVRDFRQPIPPVDEQRAIAAFLDRETARIDALIEKKRRQIELLQEKRSALISHAVTKGLNPNAPMKDSGAEWLGRVPAHWTVGNIRRFARMKTGHTPSRTNAEYWQDCTIPWFTLADVWQLRDGRRKYLGETKEKISALGLANSAAELLPAGTVIFSRTASIGFSGIMPVPMATSQDFWNWICGPSLLPDYLLCLFRSMRQEFEALLMGSTHKTIYQPIAAGITLCVPPVEEQKKIVTHVENETRRIDSLVTKVGESIDKAAEFRTALISAAVTGKIDVRQAIGKED